MYDQELRLFTEAAFRLSEIADRFDLELNKNLDADNLSQESLEWDNSEEVPSFLTANSNSDPSLEELIEEILSTPNSTEGGLQDQEDLDRSRRITSTDPDFLEQKLVRTQDIPILTGHPDFLQLSQKCSLPCTPLPEILSSLVRFSRLKLFKLTAR